MAEPKTISERTRLEMETGRLMVIRRQSFDRIQFEEKILCQRWPNIRLRWSTWDVALSTENQLVHIYNKGELLFTVPASEIPSDLVTAKLMLTLG